MSEGKYKCPECGQKEGGQLRIITHTFNCPFKRLPYCQDQAFQAEIDARHIDVQPVARPPPPDTTQINPGDEIKGECWSHKGKYMGRLIETQVTADWREKYLRCKFEKGTLSDYIDNIKCTPVPCQNGGKRRRHRHRRSHKRTRKHMKRRKQSTRKH